MVYRSEHVGAYSSPGISELSAESALTPASCETISSLVMRELSAKLLTAGRRSQICTPFVIDDKSQTSNGPQTKSDTNGKPGGVVDGKAERAQPNTPERFKSLEKDIQFNQANLAKCPPAPTEKELEAAYKQASEGKVSEVMGTLMVRAFATDNFPGMDRAIAKFQKELEKRKSPYNVTGLMQENAEEQKNIKDPEVKAVTLWLILRKKDEDVSTLAADYERNGKASQYKDRFGRVEMKVKKIIQK